MTLPDPEKHLPYIQTAWRYARGVALAQGNDIRRARRRELAEIERIMKSTDYKPFDAWKIPAKEVAQIAAHVLRARIAQAGERSRRAVRELEAAIRLQDALPYMEPAYWYYPVRQTLGRGLLMKGDAQAARDAFGESLARTPNNAWALYGLAASVCAGREEARSEGGRNAFPQSMERRKGIDRAVETVTRSRASGPAPVQIEISRIEKSSSSTSLPRTSRTKRRSSASSDVPAGAGARACP